MKKWDPDETDKKGQNFDLNVKHIFPLDWLHFSDSLNLEIIVIAFLLHPWPSHSRTQTLTFTKRYRTFKESSKIFHLDHRHKLDLRARAITTSKASLEIILATKFSPKSGCFGSCADWPTISSKLFFRFHFVSLWQPIQYCVTGSKNILLEGCQRHRLLEK